VGWEPLVVEPLGVVDMARAALAHTVPVAMRLPAVFRLERTAQLAEWDVQEEDQVP